MKDVRRALRQAREAGWRVRFHVERDPERMEPALRALETHHPDSWVRWGCRWRLADPWSTAEPLIWKAVSNDQGCARDFSAK